jgi:2-methylisocitrate lyase-like PEP mutase family enzyme
VGLRDAQHLVRAERADQLGLEIGVAREEAELFEPVACECVAEARPLERAAELRLLGRVAEARESDATAVVCEKAADRLGATNRDDDDALCVEVPPPALGQRFDRDGVARPLDENDGSGLLWRRHAVMLPLDVTERQQRKGEAFRALHEGEPFVIPNPWDTGSARVLEALGFRALATTSSGFAFTLGRLDGGVTLDEVAAHISALDSATELPVSVDLEDGFGPEPEDAARAVTRAADAGAVGGSIEDYDRGGRIYDKEHAAERVAAAAEAVAGRGFMLAGRAENHIRDNPNLDDTIARLQAYEAAGADVLYAPGLRTVDEIRAVCDAVSKPVNVLAVPSLSFAEIAEAGAQRVSVGGSLTWVATKAFADAAAAIRDEGDLSALAARVPLDEWFGT